MLYPEILQSVFGDSPEELEAAETLYGIYDRLSTDAEDIKAQISAHEDAARLLIRQADVLGVKVGELTEKISTRQEMIDNAMRSEQVQIGLTEVAAIMTDAQNEIRYREEALRAAQLRYDANRRAMDILETEISNLQTQREEILKTVEKEKKEMDNLRTVGPSSMKKRFETIDHMNELMEQKAPLEQEFADCKAQLSELYKNYEGNAEKIKAVRASLDSVVETIRKVSDEYSKCYSELEDYEKKHPTDALIANEAAVRLYDAIEREEKSINELAEAFARIKSLRKELNESWRDCEDLKGDLEWSKLKFNKTNREYNERINEVTGQDIVGEQQKLSQMAVVYDRILDWAKGGLKINAALNNFRVTAAEDLANKDRYSSIYNRFLSAGILLPSLGGFAKLLASENPQSISSPIAYLEQLQGSGE